MSDLFSRLCDFPAAVADKPALLMLDGRTVSFAEFTRTVIAFAGHAAQACIRPGDRIAIEIPNKMIRFCLILALLRIGAIAVPGATADDLRKAGIALAGVIIQRADDRATPRHIAFNQTWFVPLQAEPAGASSDASDPAKPCLLISSSGSTGAKKFMEMTINMVEQRLTHDRTGYGDTHQNRLVSLGFGSFLGFRNALRTLQRGGLLVRPAASPAATIELIRMHHVNELIIAPLVVDELVKSMEEKPVALPALKSILTLGGPIAGHLARRASELFQAEVTNGYGSAEVGFIAATKGSEWFARDGASGTVMPWIKQLEIVDELGQPQPPDTEGEVRIKLDPQFMINGYLNPGDGEDEPIRQGWFYPGDLGTLSATRDLTITGRVRELMNLGGTKTSPTRIEDRLRNINGIEQLAAFGLRNPSGYDDVGLAVCRNPAVPLAAINEAIRQTLDRGMRFRLIEVEALPVTEMGKIDRMQLKAALEGRT